MAFNPFHAKEADASEQRPATEVFKTSAEPHDKAIKSRFASSGKYTTEQLEAGADLEKPEGDQAEFDPDDKRSLYDRLKEQRDAKQEDFEFRNTFKNQMDHWRLDEDDAAFEEQRRQKLNEQQERSKQLHQEGAEFYRLARAARETVAKDNTAAVSSVSSAWDARARVEKRKMPSKPMAALKVIRAQPRASETNTVGASTESMQATSILAAKANASSSAAAALPNAACGGLPGLGAYGSEGATDDESDDNGNQA